jgi:hypothetical protein
MAGPWVKEFQRSWGALAASLGSRKLVIDLCGVTHIDPDGRDTLFEIHAETGAKFLADTPMTKYFAEEASRRATPKEEK